MTTRNAVGIIGADRGKTRTYCEIVDLLGRQLGQADQEKDRKKTRALSQTINQLQKKLGFEFVVLENILSDIDLKSPDGQENRFNNPKPQSVLSRITTVVAAAKSTLLAARRATVAERRNIGPGRLCDDDFEVCRPFVESVPFLRRIGIAVIGANEFWR